MEKRNNLLPQQEIEPLFSCYPACGLVAVPTELSWRDVRFVNGISLSSVLFCQRRSDLSEVLAVKFVYLGVTVAKKGIYFLATQHMCFFCETSLKKCAICGLCYPVSIQLHYVQLLFIYLLPAIW